jgi:hypothetical protein
VHFSTIAYLSGFGVTDCGTQPATAVAANTTVTTNRAFVEFMFNSFPALRWSPACIRVVQDRSQLKWNYRLDVQNVLLFAIWTVTEIEVVLERNADYVGDGILRLLCKIFVAISLVPERLMQ